MWFLLSFEHKVDGFSVETFEVVYREYHLLAYVEQPGLLQNLLERPAIAASAPVAVEAIAAESLAHDLEMAALMEFVSAGHSAEQFAA